MKSIKVCEYSRSRSFHDDFMLQDQASGERYQDQWSSGFLFDPDFILAECSNTVSSKACFHFTMFFTLIMMIPVHQRVLIALRDVYHAIVAERL